MAKKPSFMKPEVKVKPAPAKAPSFIKPEVKKKVMPEEPKWDAPLKPMYKREYLEEAKYMKPMTMAEIKPVKLKKKVKK